MNLTLTPIGVIHSPFKQAAGTPIQPRWAAEVTGTVELLPEFASGLKDLEGFERIWLLYWCHQARPAQLQVTPYLDQTAHGVFATRAPARPNSIGLSCVRLAGIRDGVLDVAELDVLDGSPLLDIKPYVPAFDVFAVNRVGWFSDTLPSVATADDRFEGGVPPRRPA